MRNTQKDEAAAIVELIYETIFAPAAHRGLVSRHASADGFAESIDGVTLEGVLPFLERALASDDLASGSTDAGTARNAPWEDLPLAVCVVSRGLRLVRATRKARQLLAGESMLSLRDGALVVSGRDRQTELEEAIRAATESGESRALSWIDADARKQIFLSAPASRERDEPVAMLVLNIEFGAFERLAGSLIASHQLTKSEAEVAAHLAEGLSIEEIAEHKGATVNTVRTQVKNAFAKTGVTRQGELVSLVLNGPGAWLRLVEGSRLTPSVSSAHTANQSSTEGILELLDGRRLGYADYGPQSGRPVVLCHHLLGSRNERPQDDELLERLDVRLIVPERPGIGHSTPVDKPSLSDWAESVEQLADALGLDRFHLLGFSSGGPHAAACAAFLEDRILGLGLAGSLMPSDELPRGLSIGLAQRFLTSLARRWPAGIRSILTRRYEKLHEDPHRSLEAFIDGTNTADAELFRNEVLREARLADLLDAARIPPSVFANELVMLARPWGFSLGDIELPIRIWHGRLDDFFACDQAEAMSNALPDCEGTFRDDWGHFFFYRDWEKLLGELLSSPVAH